MRVTKNVNRSEEYRQIYYDSDETIIPNFVDDLETQARIENFIFYTYVKGIRRGRNELSPTIRTLRHQRKVLLQRVRGLEAMLEDMKGLKKKHER